MAKVIATGMNNQNKYVRLIAVNDSTNVIYNNSDSSKYRAYTTSIKAYNSAFWHRSSNTQYLMTLLLDRSDTIKWQTSSDNVNWTDSVSNNFNNLYTNVYSLGNSTTVDGYYILNFALNGWASMTTDIPIFETGSEYNDYMSSVYIPPVLTSSGGAGSGYIGNSLVSNKKMVGYNVPTSSAESTKTESINEASESPVSGKPKSGNGFAKIKLIREIPKYSFRDLAKTLDIDHKQVTTQWADISPLSQYYNSDYILVTQQYNGNYFTSFDGIDGIGGDTVSYTGCRMYVPIKPIQAVSAKASVKIEPSSRTSPYSLIHLYLGHLENNEWTLNHIGGIQINGTESEWTEISKIFDSPINAEYIVVYSMDNQWHFKNVEITGDLL